MACWKPIPNACWLVLVALAGCDGPQSALQPAGKAAEKIAVLFWWMLGGGAVVWITVVLLALYAVRTHATSGDRRIRTWIIGGGAVVPTIVLSGLLVGSLPMLPELLDPPPEDSLAIEVRAKMWWWRVRYLGPNNPGSEPIELANEIRLPVGEPVEFKLAADDVIHAFWVPSLGGKVDMIPGRVTRLKLEPTKVGVFRGACAEYCGASHSLMNFDVIVMERADFDAWLQKQSEPAIEPTAASAIRGGQLFLKNGCHACHSIRGTEARGVIGPDLTHVGSRHSLAAGALKNEHADFVKWISNPKAIKPGVKMPRFGMLTDEDLESIAAYLESLK